MTAAGQAERARVLPYVGAPGQRHAGAVDYVGVSHGLRGWALDLTSRGEPLELELRADGRLLATSFCMMDRPDIDKVVNRLTQCGFIIGWSHVDLAALRAIAAATPAVEIEVLIAGEGAAVPMVCGAITAARLHEMVAAEPTGDRIPPFEEVHAYHEIATAGLFDLAGYRAAQDGRFDPGMPPLLDYLRRGEAGGARPNFCFDPRFYAEAARLAERRGALQHYLANSTTSGIAPSVHFDEAWYRRQHGTPRGAASLADYLRHRGTRAPNPWFDRDHYARESGAGGVRDLYEHFATTGVAAGLTPSAIFLGGEIPREAALWLDAVRREAGLAPLRAAPPPEPPPAPEAISLPDVATLGFAGTERLLRALAVPSRAAIEALAQAEIEAEGPKRAVAALTLMITRGLAGDHLAASRAALLFLRLPIELAAATREEIETRIAQANHSAYERARGADSASIYRMLRERGQRDYLTTVRLLEATLDGGDAIAAAQLVGELEGEHAPQLNAWGLIAISRFHQQRRDLPRALAVLRQVPPMAATEPAAEAVVLHRLIEANALEEAEARLARVPEPKPAALHAVRFRLAVWRRDAEAAAALFEAPEARRLPDWQAAEAVFRLTVPGQVATGAAQRMLRRLHALLENKGFDNHAIVQARIHYLLHSRRWDELGALFEQIAELPVGGHRETLLRKLEYYCYADNPEAAERIWQEEFRGTPLDKWEGITILRMLSEMKRWQDAGELLLEHIGKGFDFGAAAHMAMRVVRRATLHEAVLAAAERAGPAREPGLAGFVSLVNEDMAILRSARAMTLNRESGGMALRYRSSFVLQGAEPDEAEDADLCTFLCTNQRYFLSSLTFLCSFLGQSPQVGGRLFVFLDGDVPRHWYGAIAMVGARFNRHVEVVPEADFMTGAEEHRTAYGFFAGGSNLSRAAYFRLYAARWLLAKHAFRRAAYIDTDTIVRGDLSGLFRLDLGEKLIAAATEDYSQFVVDAATRNGIDPFAYFNSGVLLLRFDAPALRDAVEEAIRVSEQEPERLMFHDQCALNIAFKDRVAPLPARYNFFLRPSRDRNGFIEDGLILHFLDKPKPWDIVFDRTYREEWRVWALVLGSILPQGLYVDIFAAANRD